MTTSWTILSYQISPVIWIVYHPVLNDFLDYVRQANSQQHFSLHIRRNVMLLLSCFRIIYLSYYLHDVYAQDTI